MTVPAAAEDVSSIKQALDDKYSLTVTTSDKKDIVTPGSVLVLKKRGLVTVEVNSRIPSVNSYSNGRIVAKNGITAGIKKIPIWLPGTLGLGARAGQSVSGSERVFVNGERLWVTAIDVRDNGIVFNLYTDAYSDIRYGAILLFPFDKNSTTTVSAAVAEVAQVFDIQPLEDAKTERAGFGRQTVPGASSAPVGAPPPPLEPPPPPPADPKSISAGQTVDQVVANFGPPTKILRLPSKQIYVYSDMKVSFVNGKVIDIQ